jgi:hypothetical protein
MVMNTLPRRDTGSELPSARRWRRIVGIATAVTSVLALGFPLAAAQETIPVVAEATSTTDVPVDTTETTLPGLELGTEYTTASISDVTYDDKGNPMVNQVNEPASPPAVGIAPAERIGVDPNAEYVHSTGISYVVTKSESYMADPAAKFSFVGDSYLELDKDVLKSLIPGSVADIDGSVGRPMSNIDGWIFQGNEFDETIIKNASLYAGSNMVVTVGTNDVLAARDRYPSPVAAAAFFDNQARAALEAIRSVGPKSVVLMSNAGIIDDPEFSAYLSEMNSTIARLVPEILAGTQWKIVQFKLPTTCEGDNVHPIEGDFGQLIAFAPFV